MSRWNESSAVAIRAEPQERIEAVEHVAQRPVELIAGGRQRAARYRQIGQRRIGHVVRGVFRESGVKEDLRTLRVPLPDQAHMNGFGALHGNERRHLAAVSGWTIRIGIRGHLGRDRCTRLIPKPGTSKDQRDCNPKTEGCSSSGRHS